MKTVIRLCHWSFIVFSFLFLGSCSVAKQIGKDAEKLLLADSAIKQGHIGISVYDPTEGKYIFNHNADKYFIPASNTKLFTWYAGMKYLGDSLVAARYTYAKRVLVIIPSGDPTFMLEEFKYQPLLSFLNERKTTQILVESGNFLTSKWGNGWAWNDYDENYMVERSALPMYGNTARFYNIHDSVAGVLEQRSTYSVYPKLFSENKFWSDGLFEKPPAILKDEIVNDPKLFYRVRRNMDSNLFGFGYGYQNMKVQQIPYSTSTATSALLLTDTLGTPVVSNPKRRPYKFEPEDDSSNPRKLYSQPTDSLFKPMMHRSDNFFAEQTLLMVSNEHLGYMSDEDIIDSLLKTDLQNIPQKPRWVDGSGLSRYNLFTPQDFVWLLNKTKNEFSWERIKNILPTGGEGTLSNYYKDEAGFIYAKTGTLSNNCALSGYLITKKNKVLIFSVLVNNYPTSATPVRRAVEKFIKQLRKRY